MEVPCDKSSAWDGTVRSGEFWTAGKLVLESVLIKRYFGTSSPAAPDTDQKPREETYKQGKNLNHCSKKTFSSFLLHPNHVSSAEPLVHLAPCPTLLPSFPEDHENIFGLQEVELR